MARTEKALTGKEKEGRERQVGFEKVEQMIVAYQMIVPGDVVLVGLSGGADSVYLTEALYRLQEKYGFSLAAMHVHHNLRGEEADRDAAFAEKFCRERDIPFELASCHVRETASAQHMSLEEAGRAERFRVFDQWMAQHKGTKLALAHHRNDLAETMLHHLARGTSLSGMAALRPVRGSRIRPLLGMTRREIEEELWKLGLDWCEDSTNRSEEYTRNVLRQKVIPCLETQINAQSVEHIAAAAADLWEAEAYFAQETEKLEAAVCRVRGQHIRIGDELLKEPPLSQKYLIREMVGRAAGKKKDLTREHIETVRELFGRQAGKRVSLPYSLEAVRLYDGVELRPHSERKKEDTELLIDINGGKLQSWKEFQVKTTLKNRKSEIISENKYTKCFAYDKIKSGLVVRTRRSGDFITVHANGGKKKLKDYMIDAKIPRDERDDVLLVADGQEIVWVVGYRVSERYRVQETTEQAVQLEISGGYTNGRENQSFAQ